MSEFTDIQTQLIHAGEPEQRYDGAVCLPIFQSANYAFRGEPSYDDLKYIRLNNTPNLGFDLSIHSCTKYLNGHSDIVAGCVIGSEELVGRVTRRMNHLGACLDPHACFLLHRGMKTFALRVRQQNENATKLAAFLEDHPRIEQVNYLGLQSHLQHQRARDLFEGCGGVLSFEMQGDASDADRLMERLVLPISAPSLGGVETLITRPVTTSHSGLSIEDQARAGISEKLVRVAVGIESADDICADFT